MLHHDEVTSEAMKNPMKYAGAWQATEKFSTKVRSWESEPHTSSFQVSSAIHECELPMGRRCDL